MTRRLRRLAATTMLLLASLLGTASPVAAECTFIPPFPDIPPAVPTAGEIIVGTVVGPVASRSDFRLRIDEVLRGHARVGEVRQISYLAPNWPWTHGHGSPSAHPSCSTLMADEGEVIAIAYDALAAGGRMEANGEQWVQPPTRYHAAGLIEGDTETNRDLKRVSLAELRRLAALPMPDTATETDPAVERSLPLVALMVAMVVAMATMRRLREHA